MIFSFFGNPFPYEFGHIYKNFSSWSTTYHFSGTVFCVSNKNNKIFVKAPIKIVPQNIKKSLFQASNYIHNRMNWYFLSLEIQIHIVWNAAARSVTFTRTSIHALPHTIFHPLYERLCVFFFTQKIWGPSILTIFTFVI